MWRNKKIIRKDEKRQSYSWKRELNLRVKERANWTLINRFPKLNWHLEGKTDPIRSSIWLGKGKEAYLKRKVDNKCEKRNQKAENRKR